MKRIILTIVSILTLISFSFGTTINIPIKNKSGQSLKGYNVSLNINNHSSYNKTYSTIINSSNSIVTTIFKPTLNPGNSYTTSVIIGGQSFVKGISIPDNDIYTLDTIYVDIFTTTLSGTIEDSKTPVKNWKITLADTLFTTTDSTGKYIFNLNLNPGFYTFNFKVLDINDSVKTRNLPEIGTTTISNSNCSFGNINFSINSTILYNAPKINVHVQDSSSNTITNRVVILNDSISVKNGSYTYPTLKIGTYTFKVSVDTIIKDAQVFYNNVKINNSISGGTLTFTTPINSINDSIDVFIVIPDKKKDTTTVGINNYTTPTNKVFISNNTLNITTVKLSNVCVYNLSGQIIYSGTLNGNVLIDLTNKPTGLYIVRIDKDVIKVIK